jgi:hypothetical protein
MTSYTRIIACAATLLMLQAGSLTPAAPPSAKTIGVDVSNGVLKQQEREVEKLELIVAQRVSFIGKSQKGGTLELTVRATDQSSASLFKKHDLQVNTIPGRVFYGLFEAERPGTGEFVLTWYNNKRKEIRTKTIPVSVR